LPVLKRIVPGPSELSPAPACQMPEPLFAVSDSGLEEVLDILNRDERLDAWGKILFFLQQKTSLDGRRPVDLLRESKVKEVCLAAQAYAE